MQDNIQDTGIGPEAKSESVEIVLTGEITEEDFEGILLETFPDYDEEGYRCPCGGRLLPSGVSGVAEDEAPGKLINSAHYLYCEDCGQDYALKTVLEEVDLKEILSKED